MTEQAISPSVTTQAISPSVTTQAISPLRQRMIEDMSIRKFTAKTQHDYVQRVKDFATFLGRSPRTAESEDVRRFQLHLTAKGAGTPTINSIVSALRFFFTVTLNRPDLAKPLSSIHQPRKMPVVLSPEEVVRIATESDIGGLGSSMNDTTAASWRFPQFGHSVPPWVS
jgi:site-specific recombinase XerD